MSDPIELKALDEYLQGGSSLSRHYRELGGDEVPPELDRHVLQQAQAAVAQDRVKRSHAWWRWSAPVTLAASVVLVLAIVLDSGVQREAVLVDESRSKEKTESSSVSPMQGVMPLGDAPSSTDPAAAEQARAAATAAVVEELRDRRVPAAPEPLAAPAEKLSAELDRGVTDRLQSVEEAVAPAQSARSREFESPSPAAVLPEPQFAAEAKVDSAAGAANLSASAPVAESQALPEKQSPRREAADSELSEIIVTGVPRPPPRSVGPRGTISQQAAPDGGASAETLRNPEAWLEEIRELRRAGKEQQAEREWRRFSQAFPDYPVADDDLARKRP